MTQANAEWEALYGDDDDDDDDDVVCYHAHTHSLTLSRACAKKNMTPAGLEPTPSRFKT